MEEELVIDLSTLKIHPAYSAVADAKPLLYGLPEADWNAEDFIKVPIWANVAVDDNQRLALGGTWYDEIIQGNISIQTAIRGLRLAMSLKSMNRGNPLPLLFQQPRIANPDCGVVAPPEIPPLSQFNGSPFDLRAQHIRQGPVQQMAIIPANDTPLAPDTDDQKKISYCFLAAYLMRLLVKSPDNAVHGLPTMKRRFKSFYGPSTTVNNFRIGSAQAAAYRLALDNQAFIKTTYTHALAYTHQFKIQDLNQREVEVIDYLGFIPFAYTGMHAYTLMKDLWLFTKVPLDELLALFDAIVNAPALLKIGHIIRNYERTADNPERDLTFRYCSHWGSQYFSSVRSKNCAHLLCTLAWAWKTLSPYNENADPGKIAALSSLPASMKRTLEKAGIIIGNSLKNRMLKEEGASAT